MKRTLFLSALLATGLASAPAATPPDDSPRARVEFIDPESFTDARLSHEPVEEGRPVVLRQLREAVESLAEKHLQPGEFLVVRFTDVDMAGTFQPWAGINIIDQRVVSRSHPPRVVFEFALHDPEGRIIAEGTERLWDPDFLQGRSSADGRGAVYYETEMLRDWFRRELKELRAGS